MSTVHAPTIFVQIASYRDPECKKTIEDLYAKAALPTRIFVGLNWQYAQEDNDIPCYEDSYTERVRILRTPHSESQGACWARSLVQSLYRGEKYTLQVDAHTRFVLGWDQILVDLQKMLKTSASPKPILTAYLPNYWLDGRVNNDLRRVTAESSPSGIFIIKRSGYLLDRGLAPFIHPWLSGHFWFAEAGVIKEVPYDPHLYFLGEEISLGVRMWTHGWDLFHPAQVIAYHLYKSTRDPESGAIINTRSVPGHPDDHPEYVMSKKRAYARVRHLLGTAKSPDPKVTVSLAQYGLGGERSLCQFERFAGIDFNKMDRWIKATAGFVYPEEVPLGNDEERRQLVLAEQQLWTEEELLRETLTAIETVKGCQSIIDLGGALAFSSELFCRCFVENYICLRLSPLPAAVNAHLDQQEGKLLRLNYADVVIPQADLVYVGNLFSESSIRLIWQVLGSIATSGCHYLAVCQRKGPPLLCGPPFFLREPIRQLMLSGGEKRIFIWELDLIRILLVAASAEMSRRRRVVYDLIEENINTLRHIFSHQPRSLKRLLQALANKNSDELRQLLREPEVVQIISVEGGKAQKSLDFFEGLCWQRLQSSRHYLPNVHHQDMLWMMILTREFLMEKRGNQV